jgi:hypothetical protein
VRSAFGELTKRYHPDRFARYQSTQLRQVAAEIFITIRDAYRKLSDTASRQATLAAVKNPPPRAHAGSRPPPSSRPGAIQRVPTPPPIPITAGAHDAPTRQSKAGLEPPTKPGPGPYDAPTNQSGKTAELASTELAKGDDLAVPVAQRDGKPAGAVAISSEPPRQIVDAKSGPVRALVDAKPSPRMPAMPPRAATPPMGVPAASASAPGSTAAAGGRARSPTAGELDAVDSTALESLIDVGKLDDALTGYRALAKRQPSDRAARAGVELCEGMLALAQRDRMEAAQRFEAALELDPSNERAARELAEMRRQATNERKGLLSRLMGKKEPTE